MSDVHGIPAAWYPDPADARRMRYWDGSAWTEQLADRPAPAPSADLFAHGSVNEPTSNFTGYDHQDQGGGYIPLSRTSVSEVRGPARPTSEHAVTVAIWLYALVPLTLLPHTFFGWEASPSDFTDAAIHTGLFAAYVLFSILFAAIDRARLRARGFTSLPPAILGVLPPVHIIARVFAVGAGGVLVTLASLLVSAVVAVLLVIQYAPPADDLGPQSDAPIVSDGMTPPFTAAQITHLLTPEGMAEKLRYDAAQTSVVYQSVTCEPLTSIDLGTQTTCVGTGRIADYDILVQVLPDTSDVPFTVISVAPDMH